MEDDDYSTLMTYGGVEYGGEPDCTMRNIVIAVIVLFLLYVYVYLPNQQNNFTYDYFKSKPDPLSITTSV